MRYSGHRKSKKKISLFALLPCDKRNQSLMSIVKYKFLEYLTRGGKFIFLNLQYKNIYRGYQMTELLKLKVTVIFF